MTIISQQKSDTLQQILYIDIIKQAIFQTIFWHTSSNNVQESAPATTNVLIISSFRSRIAI